MNKVVTISLNGNAYQLEEAGYEALRRYLDTARTKLTANPDADEILRDLEQAIAEKLTRLMGVHATVASEVNVVQALAEMGPVDAQNTGETEVPSSEIPAVPHPKRLYKIREGALIGGVCNGLAAYFDIDVVVVRIAFIALTLITGGGWVLLYIIMMIVIPYADTPEKLSRASGTPWNAQEILDRAQESLAEMKKNGRAWKQRWMAERRNIKWEAQKERVTVKNYYRHSLIGELIELAILIAILWAAYAYLPGTHPFYERVGADIQQGWAWLNAAVIQ